MSPSAVSPQARPLETSLPYIRSEATGVSEFVKNTIGYLAAVVLALAVTGAAFQLWQCDLKVPLAYEGDSLVIQALIQGTMENGWYLTNPRLGMPFGQTMHDFPVTDSLHLGFIKLLGFVFHDSAVVLNLFILLSFPLTALSAYFTLRRFKLGRLAALVCGVLYGCAPYHFFRCTRHPFLAADFVLPLITLVLVRLYLGRLPFAQTNPETGQWRWRFFRPEAIGALLVCVLIGMGNIYYAFFSCFLLLMTGIKAAFRDRQWVPFLSVSLLIAAIAVTVSASLLPSLIYHSANGKNSEIIRRNAREADQFGLSVAEMLLPVCQHRFAPLAKFHSAYYAGRKMTGEYLSAPLGLLGSVGFLLLLARFLLRRRDRVERVNDGLAYLTVCAVSLGTLGGFGALFNFCVSPMIRCYNRLSIFIAYFALSGLFLLLHRLMQRHLKSQLAQWLYGAGLAILLVVGAADQTTAWFVPNYSGIRCENDSDADFGRHMEAVLPPGAMVYQLPVVGFPEQPRVGELPDYDLFRPYLHTRTLRFSYGAMKGRAASRWQVNLAYRPLSEAVRELAFAGFSGIYLDRSAYPDRGTAIEKQLARILGVERLVSQTQRQVFFDMTRYRRHLRRWYNETLWQVKYDEALNHPITLEWTEFRREEQDASSGTFRWCGPTGQLHFSNSLDRPRGIVVQMEFATWTDRPAKLVVDGELAQKELTISSKRVPLELRLCIPPGKHTLHFRCDAPGSPLGRGRRPLVFRVANVTCRFADGQ
jgi:phosphoglycerol transferase